MISVLSHTSSWFGKSEGKKSSPIALVHGVFGSGKSFMLVILIMFLSAVLDEAGDSDIRIMVASVTNVAVDNILQGLLRRNFFNFLRVGSKKRVSKVILPFTESSDKGFDGMLLLSM